MSLILALPLAFAAGLLTILSPCILPLAPIVVAAARADDPRGPFALALGLALTFAVVGGALSAFGIEVGAVAGVRVASAAIMIAVGLVLLLPSAADRLETGLGGLGAVSQRVSERLPRSGLLGHAAAGAVLALAWAPCAGPTLGAAFALAADRKIARGGGIHHVRLCARGRRGAARGRLRTRPPDREAGARARFWRERAAGSRSGFR